ncbi:hypothetical protein DFH08DRAFT_509961 [Mycena albidolilacea]|uniref:Secreted protein n=1 Tax=Mycena albidolilacea TaxID=1033008 RepID=A0AAD7AEZ8_9AGAR|nr:hypothetical protein DFH08DRAFT_509961 [Mycena albidolilacea]
MATALSSLLAFLARIMADLDWSLASTPFSMSSPGPRGRHAQLELPPLSNVWKPCTILGASNIPIVYHLFVRPRFFCPAVPKSSWQLHKANLRMGCSNVLREKWLLCLWKAFVKPRTAWPTYQEMTFPSRFLLKSPVIRFVLWI